MTKNSIPSGPFTWGDIQISQNVFIDNIPHATKRAMGEFFEYADPRLGVNTILNRNAYIEEFSVDVNMTSTDSKKYDTRVYHPMGFLLIAMESDQPKAKLMKEAIARFVWHYAQPQETTTKERNSYIREIERLTILLSTTNDAMVYKQIESTLQYYCRLASWPMPDLAQLGQDPKQLRLEGL
ncbi:MAG: hypothetical protein ABW168_00245 [Sedimenticola sp.]